MRQKDIAFITILNIMILEVLSNANIEFINHHYYREAPIDPLLPYLLYIKKYMCRDTIKKVVLCGYIFNSA